MFSYFTENEFQAKQKLLNPSLVSFSMIEDMFWELFRANLNNFSFFNNLPLNQKILISKQKSKLSTTAYKEFGETSSVKYRPHIMKVYVLYHLQNAFNIIVLFYKIW